MILSITLRSQKLRFDFRKLLENALRFVTVVVLNILPCSADFTGVHGPTMLEV